MQKRPMRIVCDTERKRLIEKEGEREREREKGREEARSDRGAEERT